MKCLRTGVNPEKNITVEVWYDYDNWTYSYWVEVSRNGVQLDGFNRDKDCTYKACQTEKTANKWFDKACDLLGVKNVVIHYSYCYGGK